MKQSPEGKVAWDSILESCTADKPLENFTIADLAGCGSNVNIVSLTTLHSSKGLQFDVVIIAGLEEGKLPNWDIQTEAALAEARRIFYVGFTRARYLVYILYSGWYQNQYGRTFKKGPSRFVLELEKSLGV